MHSLDSLSSGYPQEKVFIHFDRSIYGAGETIWFKAYVNLAGKPSFLSRIVYLELVNEKGKMIDKKMLKLDNGSAPGDFILPSSLASGNYSINAYTLWMLNFPQYIFRRSFYFTGDDFKRKPAAPLTTIDLEFHPEGGKLINGIKSVVAFRAKAPNGLPINISGSVVDSRQQEVARFSSEHDGMGIFDLTPEAGEKYAAVVSVNGVKKIYQLPLAKNEGLVLEVANYDPARILIRAERSSLSLQALQNLRLVAQMNNKLVYMGKMNFQNRKEITAAIKKEGLPAGIMHLTVMDTLGTVVAERLLYISSQLYDIKIKTGKTNTKKRAFNEWEIETANSDQLQSSLSITNSVYTKPDHGDNILSSFLLSAEVSEYVHDPGFYFKDDKASTLTALDILLITQKAKLEWNKVLKNEFPALKYPVETSLAIAGKISRLNGRSDIASGKVTFMIKGEDSTTIMSQATPDEKNRFYIPNIEFRKSAKIYYQGANLDKSKAYINVEIFPIYFDTLKTAHGFPMVDLNPNNSLSNDYQEYLDIVNADIEAGKAILLQEVKIRGKKKDRLDSLTEVYASAMFTDADKTLSPDPKMGRTGLWDYLRYEVNGFTVTDGENGPMATFDRYDGLDVLSSLPQTGIQFYLNEIPVTADVVATLSMLDVALVKVYKGSSSMVLGAARGAISIYTNKGTSLGLKGRAFDHKTMSGYALIRNFYSPDYTKLKSDSIPTDKRPTLLWQTFGKPISTAKFPVTFYNDDVTKKYKVVMQGIDKNGRMYFIEREIE